MDRGPDANEALDGGASASSNWTGMEMRYGDIMILDSIMILHTFQMVIL